jgi:biopolymer transport protein ExbB/TolQ
MSELFWQKMVEVLFGVIVIMLFLIAHLIDRSRQNRKRIAALEAVNETQKLTNDNLAKLQFETSQAVDNLMRQNKRQQQPRREPTRKNNGNRNRDQVRPRQR